MKATVASVRKWATPPLYLALLFSLLLHALGGLVFNAAGVIDNHTVPASLPVTFLSPTSEAPTLQEFRRSIALADPSASSLPNAEGFSHTTITRYPSIPSLIEARQQNPQLLSLSASNLAPRSIVPESILTQLLADRAAKQVAPPTEDMDMNTSVSRQPAGSTFLLSGPIHDRALLTLPSIPSVRSPAPAQPSVIRVDVAAMGEVKFAVLESSSGSEEKDKRAVDIIRRWRFKPVANEIGDQWGKVSIYWAAELPVSAFPTPAATEITPEETLPKP